MDMSMEWAWSDINYWAVLVALIATMAIGFVWYSPVLFANQWAKLVNLTKEDMEGKAAPALIGALIRFTKRYLVRGRYRFNRLTKLCGKLPVRAQEDRPVLH